MGKIEEKIDWKKQPYRKWKNKTYEVIRNNPRCQFVYKLLFYNWYDSVDLTGIYYFDKDKDDKRKNRAYQSLTEYEKRLIKRHHPKTTPKVFNYYKLIKSKGYLDKREFVVKVKRGGSLYDLKKTKYRTNINAYVESLDRSVDPRMVNFLNLMIYPPEVRAYILKGEKEDIFEKITDYLERIIDKWYGLFFVYAEESNWKSWEEVNGIYTLFAGDFRLMEKLQAYLDSGLEMDLDFYKIFDKNKNKKPIIKKYDFTEAYMYFMIFSHPNEICRLIGIIGSQSLITVIKHSTKERLMAIEESTYDSKRQRRHNRGMFNHTAAEYYPSFYEILYTPTKKVETTTTVMETKKNS